MPGVRGHSCSRSVHAQATRLDPWSKTFVPNVGLCIPIMPFPRILKIRAAARCVRYEVGFPHTTDRNPSPALPRHDDNAFQSDHPFGNPVAFMKKFSALGFLSFFIGFPLGALGPP